MTRDGRSSAAIRQAVPVDVDTIVAITNAAYAHYIPRIGRKPQPMVTDYGPMITENEVWLLTDNNQPVGVLVLVDKQDHFLIYNVAVDPSHQQHGFGHRLLNWAEERSKQQQYTVLRLYTNALMTENIVRYTKLGYVETSREARAGSTIVHMEKYLEG